MIFPIVNRNGTSVEQLEAQITTAAQAITAAIKALVNAAPNARDYPQGGDAYTIAAREHAKRLSALLVVRDECVSIYDHITECGATATR